MITDEQAEFRWFEATHSRPPEVCPCCGHLMWYQCAAMSMDEKNLFWCKISGMVFDEPVPYELYPQVFIRIPRNEERNPFEPITPFAKMSRKITDETNSSWQ